MKKLTHLLSSCTLSLGVALSGCDNSAPSAAQAPAQPAPVATAASTPIPQTLTTQVFNPGEQAIFAVTSVLVEGKEEAILIDAQFSAEQARKLVEIIKTSGKRLTTIYISHGDPDFYFGLDTLHEAFPDAKILATAHTIAHIQETKDKKVAVWGPQLGSNAPKHIIVPQPLVGDSLSLEGQSLKVIGLDGPSPERTLVWIPSIKTVAGGIPVMAGEHVWMADTQTPESHAHWLATLEQIKALQPTRVIPGHFVEGAAQDLAAVEFTAGYIRAFDEETAKAANAAELIAAMKQRYPGLGGEGSLELSAKVAKGEMQW